jgi:hypothetical protein
VLHEDVSVRVSVAGPKLALPLSQTTASYTVSRSLRSDVIASMSVRLRSAPVPIAEGVLRSATIGSSSASETPLGPQLPGITSEQLTSVMTPGDPSAQIRAHAALAAVTAARREASPLSLPSARVSMLATASARVSVLAKAGAAVGRAPGGTLLLRAVRRDSVLDIEVDERLGVVRSRTLSVGGVRQLRTDRSYAVDRGIVLLERDSTTRWLSEPSGVVMTVVRTTTGRRFEGALAGGTR